MSTQNANAVAITGGSITGITDLAVADGGTGSSSLAANNVLLGNGTSALQAVAPGTSGNVLTSNGSTWTSAAPVAGLTIVAQGEYSANNVHSFAVSNAKSTMFFAYFGNGAGGRDFLFSNIDWGMPTLNQNRVWYQSGVDFQVSQSGSLMAAFAAGSGTQLQVRVNANFLGGYGSPGTVRIMVVQF
jgi:hypothetical protein